MTYTINEMAETFGLSKNTILKHAGERLPAEKRGGAWFIEENNAKAFVKTLKTRTRLKAGKFVYCRVCDKPASYLRKKLCHNCYQKEWAKKKRKIDKKHHSG